jgi:hypothetical protein
MQTSFKLPYYLLRFLKTFSVNRLSDHLVYLTCNIIFVQLVKYSFANDHTVSILIVLTTSDTVFAFPSHCLNTHSILQVSLPKTASLDD